MVVSSLHLLTQDELYIIVECHLLVFFRVRCGECLALFLVPCVVVRPCGEVGRTVCVTQIAVLCIRNQPLLCLLEECLELLGCHHCRSFLFEDSTQVTVFSIVDTLIVNLWQCVQLFLQRFHLFPQLDTLELRQLVEVGILRMECKDADTAIRIAVCPRMGNRCIVDGQDLQQTLMGCCHPVDHLFQVSEVADTEARLRTKGEYGNQCSCTFHGRYGEVSLRKFIDNHIAVLHIGQCDHAVFAFFPVDIVNLTLFILLPIGDELELKGDR